MLLPEDYRKENWKIHRIASDFELHDCWILPIKPRVSPESFYEVFEFITNFYPAQDSSLIDALFKIRFTVGALMKWDGPDSWGTIPGTSEKSLADRLTPEEKNANQIQRAKRPTNMMEKFKPVYLFPNEGVLEISNRTVYALLHLGLTSQTKLTLGVYIKSRGALTTFYMTLIKPFRHWVVYPTWFRAMQANWEHHLNSPSL